MSHIYQGVATRLTDIDVPAIGAEIGCGEDEIHAVLDVEAAGSGYDHAGRVKALFEPHKFYGLLSGAELKAAVAQGLAYPRWGEKPYPADSYARIEAAMKINEPAALMATSWGHGQLLGSNYRACGFDTVVQMVIAFAESEHAQLQAMVNFIKSESIDDDLRAHRWAVFARVYNGPGYAKNSYDVKLRNAFANWQKIKDTKFVVTGPGGASGMAGSDKPAAQPAQRPVAMAPSPQKTQTPLQRVPSVPPPRPDPSTPFAFGGASFTLLGWLAKIFSRPNPAPMGLFSGELPMLTPVKPALATIGPLAGSKTYFLGATGIGSVITAYLGGGMPMQSAVVYGLSLLIVMALRHGLSTSVAQIIGSLAGNVGTVTSDPADLDLAAIVQEAVAKAIAEQLPKT